MEDDPPKRAKPIPNLILIYILAQSYINQRDKDDLTIADMITISSYYLLHPSEFMGTSLDATQFWLQDIAMYIGGCCDL
jgi:hypothetical protein